MHFSLALSYAFKGTLKFFMFMHFRENSLFLINSWGRDFQGQIYLGNSLLLIKEVHKSTS